MRARWQRLRCKGLLGVWAVFLLMAAMLFAERSGIRTRLERPGRSYLTRETTLTAAQVMRELPATCLLVCNSEDASSLDAAGQFPQILTDMKVGFAQVDLAQEPLPALEGYRTVVVTLSDLSVLGEDVLALDVCLDTAGRAQPLLEAAVNSWLCRCAGFDGLGTAAERMASVLRAFEK